MRDSRGTWTAATRDEIDEELRRGLDLCSPEQLAFLARVRIEPTLIPIERSGQLERVYMIARTSDRVVFWEDVEEGWEVATPDEDGVIRSYGASQWELPWALRELMKAAS